MGAGSAVSRAPVTGRWSTAQLTGAGLALIAACYGLARFAYGLFVPAFSDEFGLTAATAGAIACASGGEAMPVLEPARITPTASAAVFGARLMSRTPPVATAPALIARVRLPNRGVSAVDATMASQYAA